MLEFGEIDPAVGADKDGIALRIQPLQDQGQGDEDSGEIVHVQHVYGTCLENDPAGSHSGFAYGYTSKLSAGVRFF